MKAHEIDWDRFDTEIFMQQHLKSNQLALAYYRLVELYLRNQQDEKAEKAIAHVWLLIREHVQTLKS